MSVIHNPSKSELILKKCTAIFTVTLRESFTGHTSKLMQLQTCYIDEMVISMDKCLRGLNIIGYVHCCNPEEVSQVLLEEIACKCELCNCW